ncbi:MAG: hypothetical protein R2911_31490 [Caldilineaceae bacterium]
MFLPMPPLQLALAAALLLFLLLSTHNLGLPGLHYDEAKEAGLNAMELLTGAPVTAFRGASISLWGVQWPLMVQDYIGALNVYLALPLLWLTGIGVPNLRALAILTALAALLLLERAVSEWMQFRRGEQSAASMHTPVSLAGVIAVALLAVAPSFIFWSRQGIFVTNVMQPLTLGCIWQGLRWLRWGRGRALLISAFCGGLALYAKVQAVWLVGPFALLAGGWWLWQTRWARQDADTVSTTPRMTVILAVGVIGAFVLPLLPLLLFNWQTGGLWDALSRNAQTSYYGVDNADLAGNLAVRWRQLGQMLRGDHLWYLGGVYGNSLAPWLWGALIGSGLWRWPKRMTGPLLLLLAAFAMSLFTISDLFITHFALIQPLAYGAIGVAGALWLQSGANEGGRVAGPLNRGWRDFVGRFLSANAAEQGMSLYKSDLRAGDSSGQTEELARRRGDWWNWRMAVAILLLIWAGLDVAATARYYDALNRSGGLADHSDASYHLAYYLRYNGLGAPIALDWGIDAPVRFLSQGRVTPIEIFGYASVAAPDAAFVERLALFWPTQTMFICCARGQTVFQGRRQRFIEAAAKRGRRAVLEQTFAQRDGTPLFELWRVAGGE